MGAPVIARRAAYLSHRRTADGRGPQSLIWFVTKWSASIRCFRLAPSRGNSAPALPAFCVPLTISECASSDLLAGVFASAAGRSSVCERIWAARRAMHLFLAPRPGCSLRSTGRLAAFSQSGRWRSAPASHPPPRRNTFPCSGNAAWCPRRRVGWRRVACAGARSSLSMTAPRIGEPLRLRFAACSCRARQRLARTIGDCLGAWTTCSGTLLTLRRMLRRQARSLPGV